MRLLGLDAFESVFAPLQGKRIGYIRPHGNVGDGLIEWATFQLFEAFGINWQRVDPDTCAGVDVDELVFGGGGNMGNRYHRNWRLRGKALALGLPMTILPQTFTSVEDRPYKRVYVREHTSLFYCSRATVAPELALGFDCSVTRTPTRRTGVFLRRDQERISWPRFFRRDPVKLCRTPQEYLELAADYARIVTDRLHFAICGLLLQRDVTLLPNDYHKNQAMHDTWLGRWDADLPKACAKPWVENKRRQEAMLDREYCDIGPIEASRSGDTHRVSAMVCGHPVWFESANAVLRPSVEAFGSSFLVPALHARRPLRFNGPLSRLWRENVAKLVCIFHRWWDYPETLAIESEGQAVPADKKPDGAECFSGGADSFYSLLRMNHATRYLVFVHGFDMSYRDGYRMRKYRPALEEICRATGRIPIVIRTNLRKHPFFSQVMWENSHGGALAAIGHLLADSAGRIVIASSCTYDELEPWGSHWETDPLWAAENLEIVHDDATLYRLNKLKTMAEEPLVQQHLRVCFKNLAAHGNCSRCDKCVRTMLVLHRRRQLQNYPVFDRRTPLTAILDSMDPVPENMHYRYEELIRDGMPAEIEAAVRRLLARQRPPRYSRLRRTVRKVKLARRAPTRLSGCVEGSWMIVRSQPWVHRLAL